MKIGAFTALVAVVSLASAAHAELFRCKGPDGKMIYTDQKSTCPDAEASEPTGVVHRAESPDASGPGEPAARLDDSHTAADDANAEAQWKQKRVEAEQNLEQIQQQRNQVASYAKYCSRPGHYVTTVDDAGITQRVNCSDLKRELDSLEEKEAAARQYLATGLPDECRKAGCLPGWLR